MEVEKTEYATVYMRSVPTDVKKQFKAWCAKNGVTMTDKIVDLMRGTYETKQTVQ